MWCGSGGGVTGVTGVRRWSLLTDPTSHLLNCLLSRSDALTAPPPGPLYAPTLIINQAKTSEKRDQVTA